jgi:hypothetical protein
MALIGTKSVTWRVLLERAGITPGGGRFIGISAEYKTNARPLGHGGLIVGARKGRGAFLRWDNETWKTACN